MQLLCTNTVNEILQQGNHGFALGTFQGSIRNLIFLYLVLAQKTNGNWIAVHKKEYKTFQKLEDR